MDVITLRAAFIEVLLSLHVHEIKFVNKAMSLEQIQRAIHGDTIYAGIESPRVAKNLDGVEMLLGGFHDAENSAPLMRHAQTARHQFGLQASGNFSLRKRHRKLKPSCNRLTD